MIADELHAILHKKKVRCYVKMGLRSLIVYVYGGDLRRVPREFKGTPVVVHAYSHEVIKRMKPKKKQNIHIYEEREL